MTEREARRLTEDLLTRGFDNTTADVDDDDGAELDAADRVWSVRPRCSQCEVQVINGVACHERGCPNMHDGDDGVHEDADDDDDDDDDGGGGGLEEEADEPDDMDPEDVNEEITAYAR